MDKEDARRRAYTFVERFTWEPNERDVELLTDMLIEAEKRGGARAFEAAEQAIMAAYGDCFCRGKDEPCGDCMMTARIVGTLQGTAKRLAQPPEAGECALCGEPARSSPCADCRSDAKPRTEGTP